MKKLTTLLTLVALLSGASLQAQTTGETAVSRVKTAKENNWQNWTFAASALVTAAAAVFVVTMENGQHVQPSPTH